MRKLIFILVILFTIVSCSSSNEEITMPENLIPRDTLVEIIFDIHIADAYLANNRLPERKLNKNDFYTGIFVKHGYPRALFDSTIVFLSKHPDYYTDIYDDVLSKMSLFEADIEKEKAEKEKEREDARQKKIEYYESLKIDGLKDTIKTENIHDSIFMDRVTKAKERFTERKKNRIGSKDSLGVKDE